MKTKHDQPEKPYEDIELPKNTGMGIYISIFAFIFGFAIVWHILWLIVLGLIGSIACIIIVSFDEHTEYLLPAAEVAHHEHSHRRG